MHINTKVHSVVRIVLAAESHNLSPHILIESPTASLVCLTLENPRLQGRLSLYTQQLVASNFAKNQDNYPRRIICLNVIIPFSIIAYSSILSKPKWKAQAAVRGARPPGSPRSDGTAHGYHRQRSGDRFPAAENHRGLGAKPTIFGRFL